MLELVMVRSYVNLGEVVYKERPHLREPTQIRGPYRVDRRVPNHYVRRLQLPLDPVIPGRQKTEGGSRVSASVLREGRLLHEPFPFGGNVGAFLQV